MMAIAATRKATGAIDDDAAAGAGKLHGRLNAIRRSACAALAAAPLAAIPCLFAPVPPDVETLLAVASAAALFALLDLTDGLARAGEVAVAGALAVLGLGLAWWLGGGLAVLALLYLGLRLCDARLSHYPPLTVTPLAAASAACRIDAACLVTGIIASSWLLIAAASLGAFVALSNAVARQRPTGRPDFNLASGRWSELAQIALLTLGVAANLMLLGEEDRLRQFGLVGELLPVPFLLIGAVRCAQLAVTAGGPAPKLPSLGDPVIAVAAFGWAASLAGAPFLWLPS